MDVLVAGGSGFIGRSVCRILDGRGHTVTAASRSPDVPGVPAGVETATIDVTQRDVTGSISGHDAVVNLVALPSHVQPRGRTHESVHLEGTRNLLTASEECGVDRFVQMSGLGVDSSVETAYLEAKRQAERLVRESDLDWVVYRPSVVFGDGCAFIPFIEKVMPPFIAPLPGGGEMRIQPMWVEDLAPLLAAGVEDDTHVGRIYELGGPEKLTLAATVELICGGSTVVPIPKPLAAVAFTIAELIPGIPFGRDQYRVFELDNTVTENDVAAFGRSEGDLRTLAEYLAEKSNGSRPRS